jgi:hypothetical protein
VKQTFVSSLSPDAGSDANPAQPDAESVCSGKYPQERELLSRIKSCEM